MISRYFHDIPKVVGSIPMKMSHEFPVFEAQFFQDSSHEIIWNPDFLMFNLPVLHLSWDIPCLIPMFPTFVPFFPGNLNISTSPIAVFRCLVQLRRITFFRTGPEPVIQGVAIHIAMEMNICVTYIIYIYILYCITYTYIYFSILSYIILHYIVNIYIYTLYYIILY